MLESITRFGVSIEESLLKEFDQMLERQGHANRSDALRSLIRQAVLLDKQQNDEETEMAGAIVLVYEHGVSKLSTSLVSLQHEYHHSIISTMHIHLTHERCLEVLVVRDRITMLRDLTHSLRNTRGVYFAELMVSSTGCN